MSARTRWEYFSSSVIATLLRQHLNYLGEDGWDLVSVVKEGAYYELVLKRPVVKE